jgi:hypothetical protein
MRLQGGQLWLLEPCSPAAMLLLQATRHGLQLLTQQSQSLSGSGIPASSNTLPCSLHPAEGHCGEAQHGRAISGCSPKETHMRLLLLPWLRRQLQLHQQQVPPSHPCSA